MSEDIDELATEIEEHIKTYSWFLNRYIHSKQKDIEGSRAFNVFLFKGFIEEKRNKRGVKRDIKDGE
jgi:hypothetical protein